MVVSATVVDVVDGDVAVVDGASVDEDGARVVVDRAVSDEDGATADGGSPPLPLQATASTETARAARMRSAVIVPRCYEEAGATCATGQMSTWVLDAATVVAGHIGRLQVQSNEEAARCGHDTTESSISPSAG